MYIILVVPLFEEPDLVKHLGPSYVKYMESTPRYVPRLSFFNSKAKTK